jgi:hypothetical protein
MGDSFSFGGVDLSGASYGVTVVDGAMELFPNPRISAMPRPNAHGAIVKGSYLQEKHLVVPVVIEGFDHGDLLSKLHALRSLFHPRNGDQRIVLDYESGRFINGRLESGLEGTPVACRAVETQLKFLCGDPTWYGTTLRTADVTNGAMVIDYAGSEYTPLTIIGRQGTAGNSSFGSVSVRNEAMYHTAMGACEINPYRLSAGQYVRFDGDREIVEVSMDAATWIPVMQYLVLSDGLGVRAGFPQLKPGAINAIEKTGIGDFTGGFWRYEYYDRYL